MHTSRLFYEHKHTAIGFMNENLFVLLDWFHCFVLDDFMNKVNFAEANKAIEEFFVWFRQ